MKPLYNSPVLDEMYHPLLGVPREYRARLAGAVGVITAVLALINPEMALLAHYVSGRPIGIVPAEDRLKRHVAATEANLRDFTWSRAEPAGSRVNRRRVLSRAAAGAAAAAIAIGIATAVWSVPSPLAERARLLVNAVAANPDVASHVGVLLDPATVDTPETRKLYADLLAKGIPAFWTYLSAVGTPPGARLDPAGNRLITCDTAVNVWTVDGAHVAAGELTSAATDCMLVGDENRVLVYAGNVVSEYEWSGASTAATSPGRRDPGRTQMQLQREWALPPVAVIPYPAVAMSASPRVIVIASQAMDTLTVSMFSLDDDEVARLVARQTFRDAASFPMLQATAPGAILAALGNSGLTIRGFAYQVASTPPDSGRDRISRPGEENDRRFEVTQSLKGSSGFVVAINPTGREAVVIEPPEARFLDLPSGRIAATVPIEVAEPVLAAAYDPTGDWLAFVRTGVIELRQRSRLDVVASTTPISTSTTPIGLSGWTDMQLGPAGRVVLLKSTNVASVFRTDRQLPPSTAPWSEIVAALRMHTSLCMDPFARQSLFLEGPEIAQARFDACEAANGRPPVPVVRR